MTDASNHQPDDPGTEEADEVVAKPIGGFVVYTPSRNERFWRAMGFKWHHAPGPEGWTEDGIPGLYAGWAMTHTTFQFGILDRLRLLLTGRLRTTTRHVSNQPIGDLRSSTDFAISYPGERA